MDFNPLDILAAAALGDKDASPELNTSATDQPVSPGQIQLQNDKEADNEKESEMGKSGNISINRCNKSETIGERAMAPQKIPWSPDSLLSLSPEDHSVHTNPFSIDELVKDIKTKDIDINLKNIMGKSFPDDNCLNHNLTNNSHGIDIVAAKNKINSPTCKNTSNIALSLKSDMPRTGDNDSYNLPSVDNKSVDSGGEFSPASDSCQYETWALDHPYASVEGHSTYNPPLDSDDNDVCSDFSPSTEDTEQRSQNMALDCNYLKYGIMEGALASTPKLYGVDSSVERAKLPSSCSSGSPPTTGLGCKLSKFMLDKNENCDYLELPISSSNSTSVSPNKSTSKFGKFKIGTFASFSSSNLELEKYLKHQDSKSRSHPKLNINISSEPHAVGQTLGSTNLQPLLQSPSLDWNRSEAGSETQEDSSDEKTPSRLSPDMCSEKVTEWSHPLFHDHDYCLKEGQFAKNEHVKKAQTTKRKYTKRKSKLDLLNHEKIMKAKYLKKELLKQDNFLKKSVEPELEHGDPLKSNPVGRPRKRTLDKVADEEIDPETGTKMKITGKFQDQYVYYLSKSSRSTTRRRQKPSLPIFQDKIIVPAPKPGDIVVHHLTDSDIETVRRKGRGALNLPERPHHTHNISNLPTSTTSSLSTAPPALPSQSHDTISDVDIVSTILSMENDNLSSPTASHAPPTDLSSSNGLNPHQPTLTESLRQLSGDSSLSSENVFNYLISVVKEEQLLEGGNGFDTSSSALFPSIPPDAIYSKADSSDFGSTYGPENLVPVNKNHHTDNSQLQGPYQYPQTFHKNQIDEGVDLPDDFSSLIPNSQESPYSNQSLKNIFGSDVSALDSSQLSSPVPRLTSIEKTLDYLGVKDGEIKLESSDYTNPFAASLPMNEESGPTCMPDQQADETPWIVTVTLYFNDVPAIMVNSEPFIRLVDIHKQILPAKDTGILKKRCQLLNIPVLNCNEMQRYFLVQYGRAYNSKSTLIVSKEEATKLVTYYATPQPRVGRLEDSLQQKQGINGTDSKTTLQVTCPQSGVLKRKGLHKVSKKADGLYGGSSLGVSHSHDANAEQESKLTKEETESGQSKRTRHKKVNYLELLKGEEKIPSEDSILETIEAVVKAAPDYVRAEKSRSKKKKSKKSRRDESLHEKRVLKSLSKRKKSQEHGYKKSGKHHSSKLVTTDHASGKPVFLEADSGSSAALSHKKFKPLKLKVNSLLNFAGNKRPALCSPSYSSSPVKKAGLFSRSNSVVSSSSSVTSPLPPTPESMSSSNKPTIAPHSPLRILAVAHQPASALPSGESRLPSQPADIHMDLFTRPSSACVQCRTCSQFLSVPHFMRHHHVPMDNQWLASEAAHRILVPLASSDAGNKVGMSEAERRLWEEFHRLQESIGGFGEGDDESDSDVDFTDDDEDVGEEMEEEEESDHEVGKAKQKGCLQSPVIVNNHYRGLSSSFSEKPRSGSGINSSLNKFSGSTKLSATFERGDITTLVKKRPQPSEASLAKIGLVRREPFETGVLSVRPQMAPSRETTVSNVRHSSRRRKSKQFFSIENYDTVPPQSLEGCDVHGSAPYG